MALKDQPYFPFYVKDFDGDEKLKECDAEAHGVYIRIMCLMHKSKTYGKILLEQKYQQNTQQTTQQNTQQISGTCSDFALWFATKLIKHLPFTLPEIQRGVCQLIENDVLYVEGSYLCQKRMIKDGEISDKRASAGKSSAKSKADSKPNPTKEPTNIPTKEPTNLPTKEQQITANAFAIVNEDIKGDMELTEGGAGEENLGGEEETEFPDHNIGHWDLDIYISDCLKYYKEQNEFAEDRKFGFELFKKQYITFPDDEVWNRLFLWAENFNESISGKTPKRPMRGGGSWVQHFHNWLKLKPLSENPVKKPPKKLTEWREKTAEEILRERGLMK